MKKILSVVLLFVCAAAMTACSQKADIDINSITEDLLSNGVYAEELSEVSPQITIKRYGISDDEVSEVKAYSGTNAVVDEIAVFKTTDGNIDAVVEKVNAHIDSQTQLYQSYRADELPKLRDSIVTVEGDYVIVCVSEDSSKAAEIIDKY